MQLLTGLIPMNLMDRMPFLHGLGLNARVLTFAAWFACSQWFCFRLTPTLRLSLAGDACRAGGRQPRLGGNTWRRLGSKLVVLELATAVVLLVGAGLLGKSLFRLLHVSVGMEPDHLLALQVGAPQSNVCERMSR